jgi:hypothetical protein
MFDQDVNFDLDQFDLLGGMDMNAAAAAGPDKSTTTTEQHARSAATTPASSELAGQGAALQQHDPTLLGSEADPYMLAGTEFDQQMFDQEFDQPLGEMGRGLQATGPAASESEGGRQAAQEEEEEDAAGERDICTPKNMGNQEPHMLGMLVVELLCATVLPRLKSPVHNVCAGGT